MRKSKYKDMNGKIICEKDIIEQKIWWDIGCSIAIGKIIYKNGFFYIKGIMFKHFGKKKEWNEEIMCDIVDMSTWKKN